MKNIFIGIYLGFFIATLFAFNTKHYSPNQSSAEVIQSDNLYIFTDCKPIMPYDSLGIITLGVVSGTQYENIKSNLIKRTKKKYPIADGIIMNLNKNGLDQCYAIKFK